MFPRVFGEIGFRKQELVICEAGNKVFKVARHNTVVFCVALLKFQACLGGKTRDLIDTNFHGRHCCIQGVACDDAGFREIIPGRRQDNVTADTWKWTVVRFEEVIYLKSPFIYTVTNSSRGSALPLDPYLIAGRRGVLYPNRQTGKLWSNEALRYMICLVIKLFAQLLRNYLMRRNGSPSPAHVSLRSKSETVKVCKRYYTTLVNGESQESWVKILGLIFNGVNVKVRSLSTQALALTSITGTLNEFKFNVRNRAPR